MRDDACKKVLVLSVISAIVAFMARGSSCVPFSRT
jgi:hypothetical protein